VHERRHGSRVPRPARPGCASAARRHWTVRGAGA
jgi:hypothetical protein